MGHAELDDFGNNSFQQLKDHFWSGDGLPNSPFSARGESFMATLDTEFKHVKTVIKDRLALTPSATMLNLWRFIARSSDSLMVPNIILLMNVYYVMALHTAEVERGFSIHRILKNRLRSRLMILMVDSLLCIWHLAQSFTGPRESENNSLINEAAEKLSGCDGGFMHSGQSNISLLEFISNGLVGAHARAASKGGAEPSPSVHRIAFFDKQQCICDIVSQMDVIRFLADHHKKLGPLAVARIGDLGLVHNGLLTCTPDTSAIVAMGMMQDAGVSALAVLDPNGAIIGNFSASDLRTIQAGQFGALALPVGEFLALEHRVEFVGANRWHEAKPTTDTPPTTGAGTSSAGARFAQDNLSRKKPHVAGEEVGQALVLSNERSTLGELLTKMSRACVHRVYCVDATERPTGVITCSDILRGLVALAEGGS
ncbi:hypothetical protein FOA52_003101 [Chlamydomonas sp. UWO 241]|nr:hypothetical protein FOA52_003101 [Chlamydomonas sp. UWO 241]